MATYQPITIVDSGTRRRLARYFEKPWMWPYVAIALGLLLGVLGAVKYGPLSRLAAASFGVVVVGLIAHSYRKFVVVSDRDFDEIAERDFERAALLAVSRFRLEPGDLRHDPIQFRSTSTQQDVGNTFKGQRVGKDKKPRSSPHEFTIINFGHERLFVFRCVFDLTTGSTVFEVRREFAYRDVLTIESDMRRDPAAVPHSADPDELMMLWQGGGSSSLDEDIQPPGAQVLRVRLASGEVVELATIRAQSGGKPSEDAQKAQRLFELLRAFK